MYERLKNLIYYVTISHIFCIDVYFKDKNHNKLVYDIGTIRVNQSVNKPSVEVERGVARLCYPK